MSDERVPPRRQPPSLPSREALSRSSRSEYRTPDSRGTARNRSSSQDRYERYTPPPTSAYGGGNYGDPPGAVPGKGNGAISSLTVLTIVTLVAFFTGFAARNFLADRGYDDERVVKAQDVPEVFRNFCVAHNGYPSFTVLQLTSVSALTMANVPILRMDTCTIPVNQTANALQALGVSRRDASIGPQLGGSNLTLIDASLGQSMAQALVSRFPSLSSGDPATLTEVEETVTGVFTAAVDGLGLQNLLRTNIPNVYVMIPGHSFNLQPQLSGDL